MSALKAVEICAGAGGQALGLELAGFDHALAVELDTNAANTLMENRPDWKVAIGDVADTDVWNPADYQGIDLLAGGVPCPPFSIAGKQLGATDERDLFAWAVELAGQIRPRALMLENVRGLSAPRFAAYRQHVLDRLRELGYWSSWRLLNASDYGVPQLRPRFVLVAMSPDDAEYFTWPEPSPTDATVGSTLLDLMASNGWKGAQKWSERANDIAPTIVGGSKKHGGADLGPTRAKKAWASLGVDAMGVADRPPSKKDPVRLIPKLTCDMVKRIQGWHNHPSYEWRFTGRKTSTYRQIGNAFPPPVALAVGKQVHAALTRTGTFRKAVVRDEIIHDNLYQALRALDDFATMTEISEHAGEILDEGTLEKRIEYLARDFIIDRQTTKAGTAYRLGAFRGFVGQVDHERHEKFGRLRARIS